MVTARDLHKSYGAVQAVRGVSFDVGEGEIFGLLGPNGAGKTTILEMIEGMLPIDRGAASVAGIDVGRHPHYMEEAQHLCDRVAILDEGKILTVDAPRRLIDQLLATGFHKDVTVQPADLEDVFLNLTGRHLRED